MINLNVARVVDKYEAKGFNEHRDSCIRTIQIPKASTHKYSQINLLTRYHDCLYSRSQVQPLLAPLEGEVGPGESMHMPQRRGRVQKACRSYRVGWQMRTEELGTGVGFFIAGIGRHYNVHRTPVA